MKELNQISDGPEAPTGCLVVCLWICFLDSSTYHSSAIVSCRNLWESQFEIWKCYALSFTKRYACMSFYKVAFLKSTNQILQFIVFFRSYRIWENKNWELFALIFNTSSRNSSCEHDLKEEFGFDPVRQCLKFAKSADQNEKDLIKYICMYIVNDFFVFLYRDFDHILLTVSRLLMSYNKK